ncbi:GNAT family N-acetyltransferase [Uliginosibacterium sp. H3]|uniref:GNAT family N-acetyltransferase n=1 Tax=Uliginosibacterium silvisoli TaxID=3114758 RepID=A0ABU6K1S1_9RHOO|nr:GNAT family N-acetyltransferase [Uliginosibacterium sp. H3]
MLDHDNDALVLENWLKNKTPENFCSWIANTENLSLVAATQTGIVGFAMATSSGHIRLCYVMQEALFQGVGKALLAALEEMLSASGLRTLTLESTLTARPFYERNGFVKAGDPVRRMSLMATPMVKHL